MASLCHCISLARPVSLRESLDEAETGSNAMNTWSLSGRYALALLNFSSISSTRSIHSNKLSVLTCTVSMFCSTILFILLWRCSTSLAQKCYYPDGSEATRDIPCGPTSSNQAVTGCLPEDTCLSNRLCLNSFMLTRRGSCTDPTWQSEGCAPWCQDGKIPLCI